MNGYHIEPFLRRKPRARVAWRDVGLMVLGAVLGFIAFFVFLMNWGMTHAHAQGVAGIIRDGAYYTPEEFCDTL